MGGEQYDHAAFERARHACTCVWGVRSLGKLHGINMGHGRVRLTTTPGCPEHDACHGWTAERRAQQPAGSRPYCPEHGTRDCPRAALAATEEHDH